MLQPFISKSELSPKLKFQQGWATALSNILTTLHKQAWPPPSSLLALCQRAPPPLCHGTPVRDCLGVAEPCLGLGPKPDNLTVIHSKLIKHLQRCHDGERALFISVLHHQHAGPTSLCSRRLNLPMQMRQRRAGWAGDWQPDLCTEIINKYSSIMGGAVCVGEVPGSEAAYKLFFSRTIIHWAGSDSVVKVN